MKTSTVQIIHDFVGLGNTLYKRNGIGRQVTHLVVVLFTYLLRTSDMLEGLVNVTSSYSRQKGFQSTYSLQNLRIG